MFREVAQRVEHWLDVPRIVNHLKDPGKRRKAEKANRPKAQTKPPKGISKPPTSEGGRQNTERPGQATQSHHKAIN